MGEKDRIRIDKFSVYLVPEERQLLEKNAYEYNLSMSEYIRRLIWAESLAGCRWTMDREQAKQLLHETNRIANALSELTYNTREKEYADHEDWQRVVNSYYDFLSQIAKLVRLGDKGFARWEAETAEMLKNHATDKLMP